MHKRPRHARLFASALFAASAFAVFSTPARAGIMFDTTPSWNGNTGFSPFGADVSSTATYGQTFVAPSDSFLQSFTFQIAGAPYPGPSGVHLQMHAAVFVWGGSLTGNGSGGATSLVYLSPFSIPYNGNGAYESVTVHTGGTALVTGAHYVALLTLSDVNGDNSYENSTGQATWGAITLASSHVPYNNSGSSGGFVSDNNGSSFAALTALPWSNVGGDLGDLAWTANFSSTAAVPEPGSMVLWGLGTLALAFSRRGRRPKTLALEAV